MEFKALGQLEGLGGRQVLAKGAQVMRVEVVLHEPDLPGLRICRRQSQAKLRVLSLGASGVHLGQERKRALVCSPCYTKPTSR